MAEYYPLLAKAVASLPDSTPDARRAIYDRARQALVGQLRATQPPIPEADIQRESKALDDAVSRLEAEFAARTLGAQSAVLAPPAIRIPSLSPQPPAPLAPPPAPAPVLPAPPKPVVPPPPPPPSFRPASRPVPPAPAGSDAAWPASPKLDPVAAPPAPPAPSVAFTAPASTAPAYTIQPLPPVDQELAPPEAPPPPSKKGFWGRGGKTPEAVKAPAPPMAPVSAGSRRGGVRTAAFLLVIAAVAGGVGLLAYKLRDNPAEFAKGRPQPPAVEANDASGGPKIVDRIGAGRPATQPATPPVVRPTPPQPPTPAPAQPQTQPETPPVQTAETPPRPPEPAASPASLPVGQRAALLVEAPEEPSKVKTWYGNVAWKLETPSNGGLPVLRAEVDIAEARMAAVFTITRNADPRAVATHILTMRFIPGADSVVPGVAEIETPAMRIEDRAVGDALEGRTAPVTQNYFFVGLIRDDNLTARNLELLKGRAWIDVPMKLTSGRIAKITFEKGALGERLLGDALEAWK